MATKKKGNTKREYLVPEVDGNRIPELDDVTIRTLTNSLEPNAHTPSRLWIIHNAALSLLEAKARGSNGNIYPGDVDNMIAIATELADKLGLK